MNNEFDREKFIPEPQLEVVRTDLENDHYRLMKAYEKLGQKIDWLIEKKKKEKNNK